MRIPELPASLDEHQQAIYEMVKNGPRGTVRGPLALFLYSPGTAEPAQKLGEFLRYRSVFAPTLSEFIILIVARHLDCDYEWSIHAPICRSMGISNAVVDALGEGVRPNFDDEAQRIIYDFVSQLLRNNRVGDEAFREFHGMFGERGVIEATATIGYYCLAGFALNAVDMPPRGETLPPRSMKASSEV